MLFLAKNTTIYLSLSKLCPKYCRSLFFPDTVYITRRSTSPGVLLLTVYQWMSTSKGRRNYQGCRGDGILMPIPIPYPQKNLWESPQNPQNPEILHTRTLHPVYFCLMHISFYFLSCMPSVCSIIVYVLSTVLRDA